LYLLEHFDVGEEFLLAGRDGFFVLSESVYLLSNILAHNLTRELQMRHRERDRNTCVKRPALWQFCKIGTLRKQLIQRTGHLIRHSRSVDAIHEYQFCGGRINAQLLTARTCLLGG